MATAAPPTREMTVPFDSTADAPRNTLLTSCTSTRIHQTATPQSQTVEIPHLRMLLQATNEFALQQPGAQPKGTPRSPCAENVGQSRCTQPACHVSKSTSSSHLPIKLAGPDTNQKDKRAQFSQHTASHNVPQGMLEVQRGGHWDEAGGGVEESIHYTPLYHVMAAQGIPRKEQLRFHNSLLHRGSTNCQETA